MKDQIDGATTRAIRFHADGATETYYARLREGQLCSTCCEGCGHTPFPPRPFCPSCGSEEVHWTELPKEGALYAFTTQGRGFRFLEPEVLGLVEIENVGLVLAAIDAKLQDLSIGQRVTFEPCKINDELVVPRFRPI